MDLPGRGTGSGGANFYPPRLRLLPLAGTTGFFAALGLLATGSDAAFWTVAGATLFAGFAAATGVLLARALRPGPTVVVDAEGITDRTMLVPTGLVRWEEIAAVRKREIGRGRGREKLLEVVLLDPDGFRARPRSRLRRLVDRYRTLVRQPDVAIPGSMVVEPMAALIAEIQRRRPALDVMELPPPHPSLTARFGRWSRLAPPPKQHHPDAPQW